MTSNATKPTASAAVTAAVAVSKERKTVRLKELGKSILAAAFLGRWEDIFFQLTDLSKIVVQILLREIKKRKAFLERWLFAPLLSPSNTRFRVPPPLRQAKRWHALAGK